MSIGIETYHPFCFASFLNSNWAIFLYFSSSYFECENSQREIHRWKSIWLQFSENIAKQLDKLFKFNYRIFLHKYLQIVLPN